MPRKIEPYWVKMGPEPHLAHCERCGLTVAKPPLPVEIGALIAYSKGYEAIHADCKEQPNA